MSIIRGTTMTISLPFEDITDISLSDVTAVSFLLYNGNKLRDLSDQAVINTTANAITCSLSQEDTFMLSPDYDVGVEVTVLTSDGLCYRCCEYTTTVEDTKRTEVLTDGN